MKAVLVCLGIALAFGACKKSGTTGGPGGGGGGTGGWLVGTDGLMVNVSTSGTSQGYPLSCVAIPRRSVVAGTGAGRQLAPASSV